MQHNSSILYSLQGASVVYPTGGDARRTVWSGVSLDVLPGEWIAVTGPNGSGKSTLAGVLLGLCPLSSGQLVRAEHLTARGVLQSPDVQFVGDTIEEEFASVPSAAGMPREALHALCRRSLQAVGLPLEPDRELSTLSGGQKQLVNIAVALASDPDVLVLDEPTAMLDPAAREAVMDAACRVHHSGTSLIWITHRLEETAAADRVIAFRDGAVQFDGKPREFFYGDGQAQEDAGRAAAHPPCCGIGLEPPFVVRTAGELLRRGVRLEPLPLNESELGEALAKLCR